MPTVSRFFGIVIFLNYRDHDPPHFHARYGDEEVIVETRAEPLPVACPSGRFVWCWNGPICTKTP
jgi:hypothetical protein